MIPTDSNFVQVDLKDTTFRALATSASRIASLLKLRKVASDRRVVGSLDDLLGAVYALISAHQGGVVKRKGPIQMDKVLLRAEQLAEGKVRISGKWMAGFHLNSAMFRESATYDRILKIVVVGVVKLDEKLSIRREAAARLYNWRVNTNVHDVHCQVNDLKHTPKGTHDGRRKNAELKNTVAAIAELLDLIEKWVSAATPVGLSK